MDLNHNNFPILNYVLNRLPTMTRRSAASEYDIEQPPPPSPSSAQQQPYFELQERMPHLTDKDLVSSMRSAVLDVSQTRSLLQTLGDRPDHETVDAARAKIKEIEERLSREMEEVALSPRREGEAAGWRREAEKELQLYKAVVSLDEMHEAYGKMLVEAEKRLEKIYETAREGKEAEAVDEAASSSSSQPAVVEETNEEVVAILQKALGKSVKSVDLSERRLRLLPEAFGRLRELVSLNLSTNQLEVIPDAIAGLENLEELYLSSNLLESLPDTIGFLVNLKILDVSSNKLASLPDSICQCRSLVELDASFNKLTYLPTNIGYELVNLRKLSIHLNKIRSLPSSIGEMRSLAFLDVHFNELRGLPVTIGKLSNLETLNLSSNFSDLTELPNTFGDLTNLKELDLSNNQIHELPITFGRLDNLKKLNLEHNPTVIPPKEVIDEGVEAVKIFMAKRWLDLLVEEEKRSVQASEQQAQAQAGWLTRSTSWLSSAASVASETVSGYLGAIGKSNDPLMDQPR